MAHITFMPTGTTVPIIACKIRIDQAIGMALRTVRNAPILATIVLALGDWFKMVWSHARSNAAKMVKNQSSRDRPMQLLITPSVGTRHTKGAIATKADCEVPIPSIAFSAYPQPASGCFLDFRPKAVFGWSGSRAA